MAAGKVIDRDRGWNRIMGRLRKGLGGKSVTVGIQAEQASQQHEGATIGLIASVHEFGSPARNIPQRSYLASTFDAHRARYLAAVERMVKLTTTPGGTSIAMGLTELGENMRADIVQRIRSNIPPPWAESTQAAKDRAGKSGDPTLWETGTLLNSIRSVVE